MERNTLRRTTARRERRAAIRRRRILCSSEQSKLCPCPTKSLLSDKDTTCPPPRGGGIRSKVADSGREKSTNQKSHVYGENNRDKDGQKA